MRISRYEDAAVCSSSFNTSANRASTPKKGLNRSSSSGALAKTPSKAKTPNSAGRKKTPGSSKLCKTPTAGDRFIPNRSVNDFDLAHYKICTQTQQSEENQAMMSPSQLEYKAVMNENLNGDLMDKKILSFKEKPPQAPEGFQNDLRVLYTSGKMGSNAKKATRYIPQVPERILDAPDILDDYYLSLIDWSATNILAVALGSCVYLWDATTGEIHLLHEMDNVGGDYISCVNWTMDGNHLALGISNGTVELWDPSQKKRLRTMGGHPTRVGALAWNTYILSSGCRSGAIHHHDVRVAQHHVSTLQGHTQEVCGLKWNSNGTLLASGGNDNLLNIWKANSGSLLTETEPVYTFNEHQSAVKALAWCPWQTNVLASGGGTADRHIRLWNCNNGARLNAIDTKSQVCALLWSTEHKELISGHGFSQNQLNIWKYPALTKMCELTGHTARILHMCLSPDGTTVVSAGADETLRLWKCFTIDEQTKKTKSKSTSKEDNSHLRFQMR